MTVKIWIDGLGRPKQQQRKMREDEELGFKEQRRCTQLSFLSLSRPREPALGHRSSPSIEGTVSILVSFHVLCSRLLAFRCSFMC